MFSIVICKNSLRKILRRCENKPHKTFAALSSVSVDSFLRYDFISAIGDEHLPHRTGAAVSQCFTFHDHGAFLLCL